LLSGRAFLWIAVIGTGAGCGVSGVSRRAPDAGAAAPVDGGSDAPAFDAAMEGASASDDANTDDATREFDLSLDFSFVNDPSGPWRYGYTAGVTLDAGPITLDTFCTGPDEGGVGLWHPDDAGGTYSPVANPDDGGAGYYPYVGDNAGTSTDVQGAAWAVRAHEVAMEASNAGQFSVVAFVAPQAGEYQVRAHFEGIHFRLSSTDVHVLVRGTELFRASIEGYGGDPAFHAIEGDSPTADYAGEVAMGAGDVLLFAIGYGANKTNYNDTTGLTVHITRQ
jgi:hypothetical protein